MTKTQVQIGSVYSAKVSNKIARVRLVAESRHGGWDATNMDTGKPVRIKSAQRLRRCLDAKEQPATKPKAKIVTKAEYEGTPATAKEVNNAVSEAVAKAVAEKAARVAKPKAEKTPRKASGLDLAAAALKHAKAPLDAKTITERAIAGGWVTNGKTPASTLYAAIIREIQTKGEASRFRKTTRGHFESTTV